MCEAKKNTQMSRPEFFFTYFFRGYMADIGVAVKFVVRRNRRSGRSSRHGGRVWVRGRARVTLMVTRSGGGPEGIFQSGGP